MSSRRQRSILSGVGYRQVSLYFSAASFPFAIVIVAYILRCLICFCLYDIEVCESVIRHNEQSGRSPKVVTIFLLQTLVTTWLLQLHDTILTKSHFGTKFSSIYLAKCEKRLVFRLSFLTCSVWKMVLICLMQNIDMCLLYKSHQIARLVSHLINHFSKWSFTV